MGGHKPLTGMILQVGEEGEELYIYIDLYMSDRIHVTGVFTYMNGLNLWQMEVLVDIPVTLIRWVLARFSKYT